MASSWRGFNASRDDDNSFWDVMMSIMATKITILLCSSSGDTNDVRVETIEEAIDCQQSVRIAKEMSILSVIDHRYTGQAVLQMQRK